MERFEGDNSSKLLEVAQCLFNNQEEVMKVTLAEPHGPRPQDTLDWDQDRGRGHRPDVKAKTREGFRFGKDQCAYCKRKGHWKNECPKKRKKQEERAPLVLLEDAERGG